MAKAHSLPVASPLSPRSPRSPRSFRAPRSPRSSRLSPSSLGALAAGLLATSAAQGAGDASGTSIPLDRVQPGAIKVNGVLGDWTAAMTPLNRKVSGSPGTGADLGVRGGLAYDDDALYVGADIVDDKLTRTSSYGAREDRLTLTIAFANETGAFTAFEVDLFHGDPGNVAGAVIMRGGGKVAGAQLVEAPAASKGGFTLEARIPWAAFPPAARVRCGLRGALRYQDADGGSVKGVVGTAAEGPAARLPTLPIDPERAIEDTFAREKGLRGAPQFDFVADVAGDEQREHVMVWDNFLLVAGPRFRDGKQFFFNDLGTEPGGLPSFEVRDLAGTGKAQFVFRRRRGPAGRYREALEVHAMGEAALQTLFQHEVAVVTDAGQLTSAFKLEPKQIEISVGQASGFTRATYTEPPETSFDGVLLPWGTIKSQTYRWDGSRFAKSKEEAKAADEGAGAGLRPGTPAGPPPPPEPPPPRPPTADELQDQVLALYRRDRKVGAKDKPRFDLVTNVAEDGRLERILVFGRDLVVVGKGFLGGQGYAALGVGFADAKDVADVTTRDLNGDGRAEIVVRGVQHVPAPPELGKGVLDRELLLVYTVADGKIARVFAAETAVSMGDHRVSSTLGLSPAAPGGRGLELVMGPGHAAGWDPKTFPFRQETAPINGVEPLVLPWTQGSVRFKWSGAGYAR
jgi:hypothetical protein